MIVKWIDGFELRVTVRNGEAILSANREGLLSLAEQLEALAEEKTGSHLHYDDGNALEEGSASLIIEKIEHDN